MKPLHFIALLFLVIGCEKVPTAQETRPQFKEGDIIEAVLDGRKGQLTQRSFSEGWVVRFQSLSTNCEPYITIHMREHEFRPAQ